MHKIFLTGKAFFVYAQFDLGPHKKGFLTMKGKEPQRPTLPGHDVPVPSALKGLTAVFEMGTGVSPSL